MSRVKLVLLCPVILFSAVFGLLAYIWQTAFRPECAWRIALGFDQVANASVKGSEDETISSRAGKGAKKGVWHWCVLCRVLNWLDPNHCEKSVEFDEGKAA